MGKRKRSKKSAGPTQEEIWDDSALLQSWNDAVEEYKLYHSIQAKGENVEDVLLEAEASEAAGEPLEPTEPHVTQREVGMEPTAQEDSEYDSPSQEREIPRKRARVRDAATAEATNGLANASAPAMPQVVFGTGQDEGLKNLMMAWYFAGYYTGLYEGQQQRRANQQSP